MSHQRTEIELVRLKRNYYETVLRNPEHRSLNRFHADDSIRQTANVDLAADGIATGKQLGRDVGADVCHPRGAIRFSLAEEASVLYVPIVDVRGIRGGAADKDIFKYLIVALDLGGSAARLSANLSHQRRALFQVVVIVQRQFFITTLRRGDRVSVFEIFKRIEALNRKRFCTDAGDLLVDVNVKALNQRNDRHECGHADDHAEQGQS